MRSICFAPISSEVFLRTERTARSFSTMTTRAAPREAASNPSAPLPAKRSRQLFSSSVWPSQLNSVSRTRSGVGRRSPRSGTAMRRPRYSPPMMRILPGFAILLPLRFLPFFFPLVEFTSSMVALSWAARLKAGLARTRDVLNTPVSELFVRRKVDEALFEELENALLQADCGVPATQQLVASLRNKKAPDGEALKRALKEDIATLLAPLEKRLEVKGARPFVIMIAGVNGSGKTTSIGKLAKWLQSQGASVMLAAGDTF